MKYLRTLWSFCHLNAKINDEASAPINIFMWSFRKPFQRQCEEKKIRWRISFIRTFYLLLETGKVRLQIDPVVLECVRHCTANMSTSIINIYEMARCAGETVLSSLAFVHCEQENYPIKVRGTKDTADLQI